MRCAWDHFMKVLPRSIQEQVSLGDKDTLQELRLRLGQVPEFISSRGIRWGSRITGMQDLAFVVNAASQYSPWSASTCAMGFITAPGGHRIGLSGEFAVKDNLVCTIRSVTSLCIRIGRDFPGIAAKAANLDGNILILGPPGSGKTTFLRDLIRQCSDQNSVAVVDERGEIFPKDFDRGRRTDVLTGCGKQQGISMALRTMGPSCIACDEITAAEDCAALLEAGWCGVRLIATAHASSVDDLRNRAVYKPLWETKLFQTFVILQLDKSWRTERITT